MVIVGLPSLPCSTTPSSPHDRFAPRLCGVEEPPVLECEIADGLPTALQRLCDGFATAYIGDAVLQLSAPWHVP